MCKFIKRKKYKKKNINYEKYFVYDNGYYKVGNHVLDSSLNEDDIKLASEILNGHFSFYFYPGTVYLYCMLCTGKYVILNRRVPSENYEKTKSNFLEQLAVSEKADDRSNFVARHKPLP